MPCPLAVQAQCQGVRHTFADIARGMVGPIISKAGCAFLLARCNCEIYDVLSEQLCSAEGIEQRNFLLARVVVHQKLHLVGTGGEGEICEGIAPRCKAQGLCV